MKFIADFHIHSKYSRATSPQMDLENLDKWAKIKGIKVLGTGDFTHPGWFKNLKEKLEPAEEGLYRLRNQSTKTKFSARPSPQFIEGSGSNNKTRFILTAEISCIYSKDGKVRKIHIIVFAPSFEVVEKINTHLDRIGNLKADGRPILGLDVKELAKIVLNISKDCLVVPSHIWTPWFSIFGSKSGFDSIEECFEEYSKYIYAVETGLSSDPLMNWRLSSLNKITLISNSDAHSLQKLGREANVFNIEINYKSIIEAIKEKDPQKFLYTIEFFPEEGKYHYDGHRDCQINLSPQESKKHNNICPNCKKPLIIGVLNRVEELADRSARNASLACNASGSDASGHSDAGGPDGFKPKNAISFKKLIPLTEIITEVLGVVSITKQTEKEYKNLIEKFGNEFKILLEVPYSELKLITLPEIAEGIIRVRQGKVQITPGYDGVYGKISIFPKPKQKITPCQKTLF